MLYGRRMYEVMRAWESMPVGDEPQEIRDYARIWRDRDKVVFSTTLAPGDVTTARTRLETVFDAEAVRRLKEDSDRDLSIGGPGLAAAAARAGLVDEFHAFVHPVLVGGGTPFFPAGVRLDLELVDEHRFAGGVVHLHHRVRGAEQGGELR
jgi:dihydrofolate reductase